MKKNKSTIMAVCAAVIAILVLTSCGTVPTSQNSFSIRGSKSFNVFLCEYVPAEKYVEIDGKNVKLPLKEAWVEWEYRYCGRKDIRPYNKKQIVLTFRKFRLPKTHKGYITVDGQYLEWTNRRIMSEILKDDEVLPDSLQFYIIEITKPEEFKFVEDTLQTFWLVKKPQ